MENLLDLGIPEANMVVKIAGFAALVVIAIYVVLRIRDFATGTMPQNGEYVTDFESMREQGLIDEKELHLVKSAVGKAVEEQVAEEGKDDDGEEDFDG